MFEGAPVILSLALFAHSRRCPPHAFEIRLWQVRGNLVQPMNNQ
jgi:hypothetical protein